MNATFITHTDNPAMSLAFVENKEEVAAAPAGKVRVTRRSLLAGAAGLIGVSAAGTAGYAAAIEPQQLVVTPYTLKPRGWPAGRKLTITVIADLLPAVRICRCRMCSGSSIPRTR
jgi:hypothetical protein